MIAGAQLGITICSLGLGAIAEPALAHLLEAPFHALGLPERRVHPVAFVLALGVVVFLHTVVGEMVPKNITLAGPERAVLWLGPPMLAFCIATKPLLVAMQVGRPAGDPAAVADRGGRRGQDRLHRRGAGRPGHPGAHRGPARPGGARAHHRRAGAARPYGRRRPAALGDGHHGRRGRVAGLAGGAGHPHRPVAVPGRAAGHPAGARASCTSRTSSGTTGASRRAPIPAGGRSGRWPSCRRTAPWPTCCSRCAGSAGTWCWSATAAAPLGVVTLDDVLNAVVGSGVVHTRRTCVIAVGSRA